MPERKIYCSGCQLFLGTIHKATLRKNMVFLCGNCETKRYQNNNSKSSSPYQSPSLDESLFDSIFGDIFKGKK